MLYPVELRAHGQTASREGPGKKARTLMKLPRRCKRSRNRGQGRRIAFMALRFALRFLALLGLMAGLATAAGAQPAVSAADQAAIRDVIQSQVEAFRRDDGAAAFGYASPSIQGMFGRSEERRVGKECRL